MAATCEIINSGVLDPSDLVVPMHQLAISGQLNEQEPDVSDRDSANHSPSDFLSGNNHSDAQSESSNDSGKGGSDCPNGTGIDAAAARCFDVMTPPLSPAHELSTMIPQASAAGGDALIPAPLPERLFVYEFEMPQTLCGLLIGRYGAYVNHIKVKTNASLLIRKHPSNRRYKLCAVEGTKSEIDAALVLIRAKFPLKRYSSLTLAQINVAVPAAIPVLPDSVQLHLPPEVSCDVVVSAIVAPNHVFVQQITHPTYPSLARLDLCMAQCYNTFDTPALPAPIQVSMVCAAPSLSGWYRAKVVAVYPPESSAAAANDDLEEGEIVDDEDVVAKDVVVAADGADAADYDVDVCFVDYGGYSRIPASCLRQIRADFMSLPFQAVECLMANIAPTLGDEDEEQQQQGGWSAAAFSELESLTCDRLLQAHVVAYSLEGPPLIYLYQTPAGHEHQPLLVNRQLADSQVAQWVEPPASSSASSSTE